MAVKALSVEIDRSDSVRLQRQIEKAVGGMQDMTPFWEAVEMHMIDSLTQNFESGGRPNPWEPLSPYTIKQKGSSAILQDKGDLKASINSTNIEQTAHSLMIWAGDRKGLFHQFVDIDPLQQWGMYNKNRRAPMPMRPFMLFQEEDLTEIDNILERYVDDLIG